MSGKEIFISTGKELLDSGITYFYTHNGSWNGEIVIRNNRPHLYCRDIEGTLINSDRLRNDDKFNLWIIPLKYGDKTIEHIDIGFTKTFPYNTGTFVVVDKDDVDISKPESLRGHLGTIACYQCVDEDDDLIVMVSGYKDAWCGEYLLKDIRLATESEISTYKHLMGIKED